VSTPCRCRQQAAQPTAGLTSIYNDGAAGLSGRFDAVLGICDRLIHIPQRALPPPGFVMLGSLQLGTSGPQVFQGSGHMRLIRAHRSEVCSRDCHDEN
jgi:hypothetical protein